MGAAARTRVRVLLRRRPALLRAFSFGDTHTRVHCALITPTYITHPKNKKRLKLHAAWWSAKPPAVPVTVVTGLNPSRLDQLESQCKSWHGPISAAVYQVLQNKDSKEALTADNLRELRDAEALVAAFHARMEALPEGTGCQLDVMLLYETVIDDVMLVLLPINGMRNHALLQVCALGACLFV